MSTDLDTRLSGLEEKVKNLPKNNSQKGLLEALIASAKDTEKDSTKENVIEKIEDILGLVENAEAKNAEGRKTLFKLSPRLLNAVEWWKANKLFGIRYENGEFIYERREVLQLEDFSKPEVRNKALRDAPDAEAAEGILKAQQEGLARQKAEAEKAEAEARQKAAEADARAAELAAVKEAGQADLDKAEAASLAAEADAEKAARRWGEAEDTVRLLEDQIKTIEMQTEAAQNKTTALNASTEKMHADREEALELTPELETQLTSLRAAFGPVEKDLSDAEHANTEAEAALNAVNATNEDLQRQVDDIKRAIRNGEGDLDNLKRRIADLDAEKVRREGRSANLLETLNALQSEQAVLDSSILQAKAVINAANLDKMQIMTPKDQGNLFLANGATMADDGTTGIAGLAVRKAKNIAKSKAKAVRIETVAGDLKRVKGTALPQGVSFLTYEGGAHPTVGQNSYVLVSQEGKELVVRTQSAYPMAAKVASFAQYEKTDGNGRTMKVTTYDADQIETLGQADVKVLEKGKALLITFEGDRDNKVPVENFIVAVKL